MTPVLEKALRVSGVPEKLLPLFALSHDLRWTWRPEVRALFEFLDPEAWKRVRGNPVRLFREVPAERLWRAAEDPTYQEELLAMVRRLTEEDLAEPRHPGARELVAHGERVAYFSAEFGLTEVLPIYAGGLGVLAGDLLKSASDMGVPLAGVGPLLPARATSASSSTPRAGRPRRIRCWSPTSCRSPSPRRPTERRRSSRSQLAGRTVHLLIRLARVGRVPLLLLDSNLPENEPPDREVTQRLYGGGHEMRLQQEIVLGIGGSRALEKVGWGSTIRHINEGHAAFVSLEKIRHLVQEEGLSFAEAREVAATGNVFTTHTPVPAGIDVFTPEMLWKYFGSYVGELGHHLRRVLRPRPGGRRAAPRALLDGRAGDAPLDAPERGLAPARAGLAPALAGRDARTCRSSEVPIRPITNGVHPATWTAPEIAATGVAEHPEAVDRARAVEDATRRCAAGWSRCAARRSPRSAASAGCARRRSRRPAASSTPAR